MLTFNGTYKIWHCMTEIGKSIDEKFDISVSAGGSAFSFVFEEKEIKTEIFKSLHVLAPLAALKA